MTVTRHRSSLIHGGVAMFAFLLSLTCARLPDNEPSFVAVSPADSRPTGRLLGMTRDFTATLKTPTGETAVADVFSLRRADRLLPSFPTGPHLVTTTGDRITGALIG